MVQYNHGKPYQRIRGKKENDGEKLVQAYLDHWLDEDVYECIHKAAVYGIITPAVWAQFSKRVDRWRLVEEHGYVVDDAIGPYYVVAVADEEGCLQLI